VDVLKGYITDFWPSENMCSENVLIGYIRFVRANREKLARHLESF